MKNWMQLDIETYAEKDHVNTLTLLYGMFLPDIIILRIIII